MQFIASERVDKPADLLSFTRQLARLRSPCMTAAAGRRRTSMGIVLARLSTDNGSQEAYGYQLFKRQ